MRSPWNILVAVILALTTTPGAAAPVATVIADARPPDLTGANWQFGPLNRWAYTHMREILPSKAIRRDPEAFRPIPGIDEAAADLEIELDGATVRLSDAMRTLYVDGVLVLADGRAQVERYDGTLTPGHTHLLWSVSKTITGLTAASVAADGLVDLDRTVGEYVPELATSGWGRDRLRLLLDMRDSSAWTEDYAASDSTVRRQDCADGLLTGPSCADQPVVGNYRFLPTVPADPARRGRFVYKSGTTDVIAWVLEAATGRRFADLVSEHVWAPMGAERDAGITVDVGGFTLASGGMFATLRDAARVGQMMLDRGRVTDAELVPSAWLDDIMLADPADGSVYRSFTWRLNDGSGAVQARGVHGQFIHVAPETGVVIAMLSSWPDAEGGADGVSEARAIELLRAIEAAVSRSP